MARAARHNVNESNTRADIHENIVEPADAESDEDMDIAFQMRREDDVANTLGRGLVQPQSQAPEEHIQSAMQILSLESSPPEMEHEQNQVLIAQSEMALNDSEPPAAPRVQDNRGKGFPPDALITNPDQHKIRLKTFKSGLVNKIRKGFGSDTKICGFHTYRDRSKDRKGYDLDVSSEFELPMNRDLQSMLERFLNIIHETAQERERLRIPRHIALRPENDEASNSSAYLAEEQTEPLDLSGILGEKCF